MKLSVSVNIVFFKSNIQNIVFFKSDIQKVRNLSTGAKESGGKGAGADPPIFGGPAIWFGLPNIWGSF